jgi:CRISPR-associated protein Csb1
VKIPRVVRSVIRAYQVDLLHRSAQYTPPVRYANIGAIEVSAEVKAENFAREGVTDNPASWTHGGIRLRPDGEIRRDATLNITAVRELGADSDDNTLKLRRYILGLALVAFTAPQDTSLREGCQLVPDIEKASQWELVRHDGMREVFSLSQADALAYATAAAGEFGVGQNREATFDKKYAEEQVTKSKEQRDKEKRRCRAVTGEGKRE